jgi:hypothetical protein
MVGLLMVITLQWDFVVDLIIWDRILPFSGPRSLNIYDGDAASRRFNRGEVQILAAPNAQRPHASPAITIGVEP